MTHKSGKIGKFGKGIIILSLVVIGVLLVAGIWGLRYALFGGVRARSDSSQPSTTQPVSPLLFGTNMSLFNSNDARSMMTETIGSALPIMIPEWNYAPNAKPNDGKNNNNAFMWIWPIGAISAKRYVVPYNC